MVPISICSCALGRRSQGRRPFHTRPRWRALNLPVYKGDGGRRSDGGDAPRRKLRGVAMKWIVFVVLLLVVAGVVGVAILPMSVVADFAAKQAASFKFA